MAVDAVIARAGPVAVPLDYLVPNGTQIVPRTVSATLNGSAAAGAYVPCLEVIAPTGVVTARCARQINIAAGASVAVSWFPGVAEADQQTDADTASTGLQSISSPTASISVGTPTGPAATVDLPSSGVAAGTYGDATHTAQVTVAADGIVTAAAQIGISGISGTGLVKLFDSTLGAPAASIDTGAGAIPSGHDCLIVYALIQTSQAVSNSSVLLTLNGDNAAHYDYARWQIINNAASGGRGLAVNSWFFDCPGSTNSPYPGIGVLTLPAYDKATLSKVASAHDYQLDQGAGTWELGHFAFGWRSTAAVNQITMTASSGNLITGSRLIIYGTQ